MFYLVHLVKMLITVIQKELIQLETHAYLTFALSKNPFSACHHLTLMILVQDFSQE